MPGWLERVGRSMGGGDKAAQLILEIDVCKPLAVLFL